MRLPSFTSNNKRCEVPSLKHLRYIQNVSCVLKFKFNLTAYVTQQSYPKNTRTELEWKRNCRNEALEGKRVGRLLFTYTSEGGPELTSRCCCGVVLPSQSSWSALDGYSKCTWPDCHDSSMTTCNEASECSCSFDSGQCCGHCECCGFIFVVLVLLLTKVPENTAWLLVISCKNVQIGSVSESQYPESKPTNSWSFSEILLPCSLPNSPRLFSGQVSTPPNFSSYIFQSSFSLNITTTLSSYTLQNQQ